MFRAMQNNCNLGSLSYYLKQVFFTQKYSKTQCDPFDSLGYKIPGVFWSQWVTFQDFITLCWYKKGRCHKNVPKTCG